MRKISLLIITALAFNSCSSDSGSSEPPYVAAPSVFRMYVNGVEKLYGIPTTYKTDNTFTIGAFLDDIRFSFEKNGDFGYFNVDLNRPSWETSLFYSHLDYSSNYFDLTIESIDEVHKRVKGTYSGYLNANPLDAQSETKFVNGDFDLDYLDRVPAISNLHNQAKINGVDWSRSNKYMVHGTQNEYIIEHDLSDDPFKIMIYYTKTTSIGTYNFSNTDITNKIGFSRFAPMTDAYINYVCSGTMQVLDNNNGIISGTYQFTATNPGSPGDVIEVTNGDFKVFNKN